LLCNSGGCLPNFVVCHVTELYNLNLHPHENLMSHFQCKYMYIWILKLIFHKIKIIFVKCSTHGTVNVVMWYSLDLYLIGCLLVLCACK
jgi:hypothetical protein